MGLLLLFVLIRVLPVFPAPDALSPFMTGILPQIGLDRKRALAPECARKGGTKGCRNE